MNHLQVCDFRLLPKCKYGLHSSGILRSIDCLLVKDVSGHPVFPIFKGTDRLS
jgi:hypothetical protein